MKNLTVAFSIPAVFLFKNKKTLLVPSMILSTLSVCILTTFLPQFMTLWMECATVPSAS